MDALERAPAAVVRRREPLRIPLREVNGVLVQVIAPYRGFVLPVEDVSGDAPDAAAGPRLTIASKARSSGVRSTT